MSYEKEEDGLWSTPTSTTLLEKQNWIGVPIIAKYSFNPGKKFIPFVLGGFGFSHLVTTTGNPTLVDRPSINDEAETPSRSPDVDYDFKRKVWNRSLILGGGFRYKWGLHYLVADVRYNFGLANLYDYSGSVFDYSHSINSGENVDNTTPSLVSSGTPVFRQGASDDFFRMNNLIISIGYQHQLYKPRELKKARTGSIFRNLGKQK
jgi:hypothetical protein